METSSRRIAPLRSWPRTLGTAATAVVALGAIATSAGAATPTAPRLGASGSVAALSASSMEVQNPSTGQTTVDWTTTTQFSKTVTASVGSLTVGDCITVTGTPSKKSKTTVAARDISVSQPTSSGSCASTSGFRTSTGNGRPNGPGGFAFRAGNGSSADAKGAPPQFSQRAGSGKGNFPNRFGSFAFASGKVTAVSGSTLTVSGIAVVPGSLPSVGKSNSKEKRPAPPTTQTLKITTTSSTTVNATQQAASTDLAVGDCVTAFGPAASNGTVTATNVRITSTTSASDCVFPGLRGGGDGGGPVFSGGPGGGGA